MRNNEANRPPLLLPRATTSIEMNPVVTDEPVMVWVALIGWLHVKKDAVLFHEMSVVHGPFIII